MNNENLKEANTHRSPDLLAVETALMRAALRAREKAALFGRGIMIWRDGRVVELMPDDSIRELPGNDAFGG